MPGWKGDIERVDIEKRLENEKLGTYVLHRDKMWNEVMKVETYLITVKEEDKKIAEQMIVHTKWGWTVYRDNPDLNDIEYYKYFNNFEEALHRLIPNAKIPLL